MHELAAQIAQATDVIHAHWGQQPYAGIVLGTGLGSVAGQIQTEATLDYAAIPHFPRSTSVGHAGQLVCGLLQGVPVVAMEGRFHAYEGYSQRQITFPIRVMRALGAELLMVSNACGGINPLYSLGDIVAIDDHINLMGDNPLIGVNDDNLGPRFPDMSRPYDPVLIRRALEIARRENFVAHRGVYAGGDRPESRNPGRIPLSADHRGRRGGHVNRAGSDRGGPRRHEGLGPVDRHRPLFARRPEAGQHRGNSGHRRRSRAETAEDRLGRARPRSIVGCVKRTLLAHGRFVVRFTHPTRIPSFGYSVVRPGYPNPGNTVLIQQIAERTTTANPKVASHNHA